MDNQHKLIKGYRDLSAEEIALMNEIKEQAEVLRGLVNKVEGHLNATCKYVQEETCIEDRGYAVVGGFSVRQGEWAYGPDAETRRWQAANPQYWAQQGKEDLSVGIMKLVRAVAQPTTF